MGKRGAKKGGRGGGGLGRGGGGHHPRRSERSNKADIDRVNERYQRYYDELDIVPEQEKETFWEVLRRDLPNSFRFTGSKAHALAVQQRLQDFYIPEIRSITYEGDFVQAPHPVSWYPDQLAWFMTTPKNVIRRFPPFASFQKFLVAETDVGNISRQEVVSMIPPLLMDIKAGMTVLDLCAAPGSKSAQLIEMVHGGEEERASQMLADIANGVTRTDCIDCDDDGRSTGLLIANDVDYKRAHMLVHQMKRLNSPNTIVTNHDATVYPSIKLPSEPSVNGKPVPNRYLKFDRILADVPCSGDGTARKNVEIWRNWTPSNGLGLHATQIRILVRALQMLKVGGRVVYSTCSMNPVENEAVLATAIERCGGQDQVELVDTSKYLPGLNRYPGLREWKVMDKAGRIWKSYSDVSEQRTSHGDDGLSRLQESMFAPDNDLPLERAMRVYPHLQDTGAFFIAILEKKSEIKAKPEEKGKCEPKQVAVANGNSTATEKTEITDEPQLEVSQQESLTVAKRKRKDEEDDDENSVDLTVKRVKSNEKLPPDVSVTPTDQSPVMSNGATKINSIANLPATKSDIPYKTKRKNGQPFEEPFKYLDDDLEDLEWIRRFYDLSPRFPRDRFMVRNAAGTASKNIYYTTALAKAILQENEGKGMKFVHSGGKMFVKQDVPSAEVCPWRIQTDGLPILDAWVGPARVVRLWKKETLRKLLIEMFPRFHGEDWKDLGEIGEQVKDITMGCCVLRVEPSDDEESLSERMVFPLWKSLHSLNLMLPKEERKALLLRLFNDDTPLLNLTQKQKDNKKETVEQKVEEEEEEPQNTQNERNSSSPEAMFPATANTVEDPDLEDGGVALS